MQSVLLYWQRMSNYQWHLHLVILYSVLVKIQCKYSICIVLNVNKILFFTVQFFRHESYCWNSIQRQQYKRFAAVLQIHSIASIATDDNSSDLSVMLSLPDLTSRRVALQIFTYTQCKLCTSKPTISFDYRVHHLISSGILCFLILKILKPFS